jgi:predicted HAD superfamily Cof-like phosphohydrolase
MTMTNYQQTAQWLQTCGKEPGNDQHINTQVGCAIEEFCEFLSVLRSPSEGYAKLIERTRIDLDWFAGKLKRGEQSVYVPIHLREFALDALCDVEVTINGVAYLMGFDKDEADQEVLRSNNSKLNADGTAVILDGGKIGKSGLYTPPNLTPFI